MITKKFKAKQSFVFLIICWMTITSIQAQDKGDTTILNHTTTHIIPFEFFNNKTLLSVKIGNAPSLKLILDSGMGWDGLLIYNPDVRESLQLVNPQKAEIGGAGGGSTRTTLFSDSMSFSIGDIEFKNQRVVVLQSDQFKGFPSDGVVGYSLLGHYTLEVNHDKEILILHDPEKFSPDGSWVEIPITFKENNIPWVQADIVIGSEKPVTLACYIDYASSEAIELLLKPGQKFRLPDDTREVQLGRGISGDIYGKQGKIAKVILGPFEINNVLAAFTPAEIRSKQKGADGVIAGNLLRRFNLIFDYMNKKLYLKPSPHFREPF
jgi:hypothetical protein